MNYEELVKALRYCKVDYCSSCLGCPMYADYEGSGCINEMHDSAAAAIEELQSILTEADKKQAYQHDYICELVAEKEELQAETERLKAQLPKRGEIVRCRECRWGHLCVIGQHLGLDGFCSKGEREVQDESAGSV